MEVFFLLNDIYSIKMSSETKQKQTEPRFVSSSASHKTIRQPRLIFAPNMMWKAQNKKLNELIPSFCIENRGKENQINYNRTHQAF